MPQWPHEYTVRDWLPDRVDEFFALGRAILRFGERRRWGRYNHPYFELDGCSYWVMDDRVLENNGVINRRTPCYQAEAPRPTAVARSCGRRASPS